jgi:hypothetical protein
MDKFGKPAVWNDNGKKESEEETIGLLLQKGLALGMVSDRSGTFSCLKGIERRGEKGEMLKPSPVDIKRFESPAYLRIAFGNQTISNWKKRVRRPLSRSWRLTALRPCLAAGLPLSYAIVVLQKNSAAFIRALLGRP